MWDVFISHASEDKDAIARPLADALSASGLRVWFDDYSLTVGDSLRRSIDEGIRDSRYGIVILSPHFFAKQWPQRELDSLTAVELHSGKTILPIWHNVDADEVRRFSPALADKLAVSTSNGFDKVLQQIARVLAVGDSTIVGNELWVRPVHQIIRFLHTRILLPRNRHNPIDSSLRFCKQVLCFKMAKSVSSTISLDSQAIDATRDAIEAVDQLNAIAIAATRLYAIQGSSLRRFAPIGSGWFDPNNSFGTDIGTLRASLSTVVSTRAVTNGQVFAITSKIHRIEDDLFSSDSALRLSLLSFVVPITDAVHHSLEMTRDRLHDNNYESLYEHISRDFNSHAMSIEDGLINGVLCDPNLLREVLRNALTNMRHSLKHTSQFQSASIRVIESHLQSEGSDIDAAEFKDVIFTTSGQPPSRNPLEIDNSTIAHHRNALRDYGGDLFFQSVEGKNILTVRLISWNVPKHIYGNA